MSDKARAEQAAADGARLRAFMATRAAPAPAAAPPVMSMPGPDAEHQRLLRAAAKRVAFQARSSSPQPVVVAARTPAAPWVGIVPPEQAAMAAQVTALLAAMAAQARAMPSYAAVTSGAARLTPITGSAGRPTVPFPMGTQDVTRRLAPSCVSDATTPRPVGGGDVPAATQLPVSILRRGAISFLLFWKFSTRLRLFRAHA
jgi:hypothetical protein